MTFVYAIALLGVLIFVHELGHFIFAKSVGIKVLKFSLGFGPKVIGRTYGETEYLISAVPLGGYVKMMGQSDTPEEAEEEVIPEEERHRAYSFQPVWKRFAVIVSGPLFNLFFAALVFTGIFLSGVPVAKPEAGKIEEGSPARAAGLATGDRIVEINGTAIQSWDEIDSAVDASGGKPLVMRVNRGGEAATVTVMPKKKKGRDLFGEEREGWDIGAFPLVFPIVGDVMKGSRAEKAGLAGGDRILEIEGKPLTTWQDMTEIIHGNPEKPLRFVVQRGGVSAGAKDLPAQGSAGIKEFVITPEKKSFRTPDGSKDIGLIGISPASNDFIRRFGLPAAVSRGAGKTWEMSVLTIVSMYKLIQRIIPADTIGGPIMIFQMAGKQAAQGALSFFTFMAVISVNLGVLNLLPIPVLDGGHLLFLGIEAVRRKPLSEKTMLMAQKVGIAILASLMLFALYNDVTRLFTGKILP